MELKVHTMHSAEIHELCKKHHLFSFLIGSNFPLNQANNWTMKNFHWNYKNESIYGLRVMFIGKTGYGKSTTLNTIIGYNIFKTNDVSVCTKDLYEAAYRICSKKKTFFFFSDLPGVGESNYADNHYYQWYRDMLTKSHCVVYLLRADQRDFAVDEIIFKEMFKSKEEKERVIIAINYADKIEPINRSNHLSQNQIINLNKKIDEVARIFSVSKENIVYYSAVEKININLLIEKIANKIRPYTT